MYKFYISFDVFYVWEKDFLTNEEKYVSIVYNQIMEINKGKYE